MKCLKLLTLPFYLLVFIFGFLMAAPAAHAAVSKILVVPTETSATIYWNSSSKEPSAVTYGLIAGSLIKAANDPVPVSFHSVTLSPLVPNTTYYFHIVEQKNDQPKLTSTFRTLGSGTQSLGAQLLSFTKNLKLGTTDPEVKELQKILNSNPKTQVALVGPGSPGLETNYFGPATARAVSKFQELYAKEILAPNNLTRGTGSVAGSTRAKLNSLVVASNKSLATTGKPTIQTPVYAPPVSSVGNAGGGGGYSGSSGSGGSSPSASPSYSPTPSPSPSGTPSPSPTPTTPTPSPTPSPSPSPSAPLAGTCSDGTDNDGNGKTDMADFGCFGPNQQEGLSNSVYTMFTPSSDSKIYYVSSSGSDSNDGLSSATPLKTLGKGISMLRDGYPDWVLLKRGETWNDESIYVAGAVYNTGKSGRSASEPFLISSYGSSSDRPLCNNCAIVGGSGWQISNLAITGLHFKYVHGSGSKNENAIQLLSYGANITIEDNYVEQYSFNINIGPNGGIYDGVKFRNNVIVDAHGGGLSSGMIWGGVKNGIIENNVIDHNGWYEDGNPANAATTRNHNNYLYYTGYPLIIRNNIISRGSSHGITMPGGIVDGNLFVQNAIALLTTQDVKINNNVFNDARDIDSSNLRGWGMSLQSPTGEIGNNLFVHQVTGAGGSPIIFEFPISGMDIHDNTAYNWCGSRGCDPYWSSALSIPTGSTGLNKLTNNIFQQADGPLIVSDSDLKQVFTFSGNHYYSGGDGTRWFASPTKGASIAKTGWASYSGESNATYGQANFVDATRTVATYNASLGGAGSVSAFLTEARKMSKGNYRSQYMPTATNAWMKAGYTVTSYSQSGTATTYTITATAGTGGTISPSGSVAAGAGFPKTFTITTNSSYAINTVTVDGVSQGAITSYTFPSVAANHTISVSFTQSTTAKFAVGDRVSATAQLNVRATPSTSGSPLGTQAYGVSGTVVAGPASANGFNWYNINYDSGSDGWSVEDYLQASAVAAPTAPVAPTSFTATAGGSSQINLSWSASTGATFYKLERSTSPTSGFSQIVTVSPTSYADTGLSANTTYYYRIRATNNAGDSVYSATVNATTQAVVSGGSGSTGYASCFDGVDNDGDGTTDMNDFSCFGPNQREATTDPIYTMYTPSSDSKVYYVSSATGSDANTGLDPQHPLATIRYAVGLMRDGYPDWVLLKRGDTWSSETFGMSKSWGASKAGRSASEPFVIGSYGSSATRPLCNDCVFQGNSNEHIGNLAVLGLHMRRIDPTDSTTAFAIYFLSYGENITFEDNLLEQYAFNVHMSANGGVFTNVKFRYNLILDAYNGGYSSGMLLGGTPGLLLEGNVVDHNGWKNPGYPASTFDHNIYGYYAGGPVTVRNNIIARASSHGFTIPGGLVEDNLFLQNPIAMMTAGFATIRNNVINDGADSDTQPRGYGYWGSAKDIELYNNYFIHQVTGSGGTPMFFDSGSNNMSIHDNVVYDWCGSSAPGCTTFNSLYYGTPLYIGGSLTGTNTVSNNIFWLVGGIMYRFESDPSGVFTFSGNHYDTRGDAARFVAAPNSIPLSNWQTFSGETNATYGQPTFVDSTRTAATYNASFGGTNSIDAFLTEARKLSKTNYRAQYTAAAADTWIKAGYAVTGYAAGPTITPTPSPSPSPSPTPTPSPSPSPSPSPTPAPSPSPTPSPSPSPSPVSVPGLLHYYSFDGNANDTAGSANGTLVNNPTFTTGHSGQALQLSGGSYVDLGYAASLSGAQDFTVSLWVNTSASQGAQPLVLQVDAGSPGYNGGYSLALTSGWYQRTTFDLSNNGAQFGYEVLRADPKINDGAWHLITATRSGNDGVIYIDGVSSATATGTSKALDSAIKTIIGLNLRDPSSYFTGLIDDVRIYGRALTAQEVQTIYNGSVALGQQPSNKSFFGSIWAAFSNLFR